MKSILYAGAALMIGASVYGFADFSNNSRNKEFKNLYEDKPVVTTVETTKTEKVVSPAKENSVVIKKSTSVTKKSRPASPAAIKSANKEHVTPVEVIEPETVTVNTTTLAENTTEKKYTEAKKKKKINRKMFSRGGMREEYYIDKVKPVSEKKSSSKEL